MKLYKIKKKVVLLLDNKTNQIMAFRTLRSLYDYCGKYLGLSLSALYKKNLYSNRFTAGDSDIIILDY